MVPSASVKLLPVVSLLYAMEGPPLDSVGISSTEITVEVAEVPTVEVW